MECDQIGVFFQHSPICCLYTSFIGIGLLLSHWSKKSSTVDMTWSYEPFSQPSYTNWFLCSFFVMNFKCMTLLSYFLSNVIFIQAQWVKINCLICLLSWFLLPLSIMMIENNQVQRKRRLTFIKLGIVWHKAKSKEHPMRTELINKDLWD